MVEFAIVAPLLFMLIFGMIEFGIMFYDKAVITNASREGVRAYITGLDECEVISIVSNYCNANLFNLGSNDLDFELDPLDPIAIELHS